MTLGKSSARRATVLTPRANGVKFRRKLSLTPRQHRGAREGLDEGETQRSVARSYNVSQSAVSRLSA
jgi:hypothetical protein